MTTESESQSGRFVGPTPEERAPVALPARYQYPWREPFEQPILERLPNARAVLDMGSGRHPAITPDRRPVGLRYVGLDLSQSELDAAGEGAYTDVVAADATVMQPQLVGQFDLVVSWQVLEHVRDLSDTVENIRQYLNPGGTLVTVFSGLWSAFGLANKVLPNELGHRVVAKVMRRKETNTPVFPAYYDKCYSTALEGVFAPWATAEIRPLYRGATYFAFSPVLMRTYLAYENLACRRNMANLATHYLVIATR
ncbi:class I SAM-dependent methyltransferase [Svornostia abyssi]|uniref:Class I SAM-dependent methyltransferase n=1 Tax=Svornostia abyssi TaxID=2898438 RepID=A0ABY5PE69_9ACTN|nr:class I SAM-dependent methyltransferase [Parviterribacteraceae bacterium J379]